MATTPTYDPDKVVVSFMGNILTHFADGTFVTLERNEDAFTLMVGADGETARARNQNRSGTLTLTLMQTSPSNDILAALAAADELDGLGVGPLLVKDLQGSTLALAQNAWIKKIATAEFGKELGSREWVFEMDSLQLFNGGIV